MAREDPQADPGKFLSAMEKYVALGIDHVQVALVTPDPVRYITEVDEQVILALSQIGK